MIVSILFIFLAVYIIRKVSSSFDLAANYLTRNIGEGIKGPTINAVASSLPELLISFIFLFHFKDIEGFSAGYATIIGSSAFNIALIPVISFLFIFFKNGKDTIFEIKKSIVKQDGFFLLGSISILSLGFFIGITSYLSILLISFYFFYIYYVIKKRKKHKYKNKKHDLSSRLDDKTTPKEHDSKFYSEESGNFLSSLFGFRLFQLFFGGKVNPFTSIVIIFISVAIIGVSCYCLVRATEIISDELEISLFFTAFIVAAIASSIPDTIFSVKDAQNNKFIDSFSNAYGSNIFDICIGLGLPVLVYSSIYGTINMNMPIERVGGWIGDYVLDGNLFIWSLLVLFFFTAIVSLIYYKGNLKLNTAFLVFSLYLSFIITLLIF